MLLRSIGLVAAALCLFVSTPTGAQPAPRIPRIGVLWQTLPPPPLHPHVASLLMGLQDLGWEDGRTVAIEYRYGGNDAARLAELAGELVRLKVDVITTAGDLSTRAAQQATSSIPIVALVGFPVESGFVKSLARPGGNITGYAVIADELAAKRLELLREQLPRLKRVAVLWDPVTHERQPKAAEAAARNFGLDVQVVTARTLGDLDGAFEAAVNARAEAILVLISPMFIGNRSALARLASQHRIPAMFHHPTFTEAGGMIAYGPSLNEQWREIASMIDKLLRGARAAELPVQQPTRFELDVNLKAAREIGVKVPQSILMRADRIIE
jgi:putative ABC transport system substrate-binding protein